VSHRREQKEKLRREREEREQKARDAQRRKKLVGYGAGGALALVVTVVLVLLLAGGSEESGAGGTDPSGVFPEGGSFPEQQVFDVGPAARAAGCEVRSAEGSGSQTHTTTLEERVEYETNPPTTGRHFQVPGEDGIYGEAPQDEVLVHNLEHGRVIFWVRPNLPQQQRANIRALVEDDPYQMVLVPRRDMPYAVAASAWNGEPEPDGTGRLLLCDEVTDETFDALASFRDEHRSQGPEAIP
jgi:Protein of unknown function (DUF3105)